MTARFIIGDTRDVLAAMPAQSVDLVLTSPPFLALRSYLPADHPDKAKEMGSEPTPGEFIDGLLDVVEACRRVLTPHGSMCFELGDTYSGSGGAGGDYNDDGLRAGQERFDGSAARLRTRPRTDGGQYANHQAGGTKYNAAVERPIKGREGWPLDKSLCLIPELLRVALVYGFNPLTGRQTPRWRARNVIRWCRPNPPVGALGDKVRPATSDMVVACVDRRRYFDLDAIREPHKRREEWREGQTASYRPSADGYEKSRVNTINPAGAPPLDHWWYDDVFEQDAWNIATAPYKGSHYATWPPELLVKPILAMCPQKVCTVCGKPSERITESELEVLSGSRGRKADALGNTTTMARTQSKSTTLGWTDCGHDSWRPGVVLDPFGGSGTTLAVATGHGRDAIGIDLDERNADLAFERVGMFLEVEHHDTRKGAA